MKALLLMTALAVVAFAADTRTNYNIPLWDEGKVPLAAEDGPLDRPFLTVFEPPPGKANGASVVIAPGGSNIMLMYGAEGMEVAERYNEWGVTAFVLTYRLSPRYDARARTLDGIRAMQIVRSRAAAMKLDPARVGLIGFSAGSELARYTVATSAPPDPQASDPVARFSARPAYVGLVYSVGRPTPGESLKDFPPVFLCAAQFDRGTSMASAQFFMDVSKAGAIAELHLYQKGRHGFGAAFGTVEHGEWMAALKHFIDVGGFLK